MLSYIESFRVGIACYMMNTYDFFSKINTELNMQTTNYYNSLNKILLSDYQVNNFNSFYIYDKDPN